MDEGSGDFGLGIRTYYRLERYKFFVRVDKILFRVLNLLNEVTNYFEERKISRFLRAFFAFSIISLPFFFFENRFLRARSFLRDSVEICLMND